MMLTLPLLCTECPAARRAERGRAAGGEREGCREGCRAQHGIEDEGLEQTQEQGRACRSTKGG